jgi:hypothetical protein
MAQAVESIHGFIKVIGPLSLTDGNSPKFRLALHLFTPEFAVERVGEFESGPNT